MENSQKTTIESNGYNGSEPARKCPHFNETKPLSAFGYRNIGDGDIRNQSWCKECRGER